MIINPGIRRGGGSFESRLANRPCAATITTPVDSTLTAAVGVKTCSTGAIVIDSVAVGTGIVVVNGYWRLS